MVKTDTPKGMLSPYRVLDLTDEKGLLCGKLLADLGADVIKIEPPGGDPARNIGPFYHDEPDPGKSLFWLAFNTGKRSITLDIGTATGQETFKRLVRMADTVIETFSPGYLDSIGLGYSVLEKLNPGVVFVSITPFGQTGPYRDYKAPDIVAWAMGGYMYPFGDPNRPPIRISHHSQAYLHAAGEAVAGVLLALHHRERTGAGQRVDVSIQESVARLDMTQKWDMTGVSLRRGEWLTPRNIRATYIWPCKDGHVMWNFWFGPAALLWTVPFVQWMDSEGLADDFIRSLDFASLSATTEDEFVQLEKLAARIEEPTRRFFLAHTKAELLEEAVKRRLMLFPVATTADLLESVQLKTRDFWTELEHPELGASLVYPGAFAHASETPPQVRSRAPRLGEHNVEVRAELADREKASSAVKSNRSPGKSEQTRISERLLAGVKVADFSWAYVGPITTKLLADYGATVIKIEGRTRPDVERATVPPFKDNIPGLNRGGHFNFVNTSKLSLALNLATAKGIEVAKRVVAWADIVVDNFSGGTMERMGLGYEALRQSNPDIIMLSSSMMGQTGPHSTLPGFGQHLTSLAGLAQIAGWPDRPPGWLGYYTDFIAPHFNITLLLSALLYRTQSGKGQYFDVSQYENCIHFMAPLVLDYIANRRVAVRDGNRLTGAAPHGAYRCHGDDRWCVIAVFSDKEWDGFGQVIGRPAWTTSAKFATLLARKQNEDELDRLLEAWTINYSAEEVMKRLQAAGVPAGVVQSGEDLMEHDPQLKHRRFFWELNHPEVGKYRTSGPSFQLSKAPCEVRRAPLLGEHNEYILKNILALSDEDIAQLVIDGILE